MSPACRPCWTKSSSKAEKLLSFPLCLSCPVCEMEGKYYLSHRWLLWLCALIPHKCLSRCLTHSKYWVSVIINSSSGDIIHSVYLGTWHRVAQSKPSIREHWKETKCLLKHQCTLFILGVMVRMFSFILLAPAVWEALNAEPKKKKKTGFCSRRVYRAAWEMKPVGR